MIPALLSANMDGVLSGSKSSLGKSDSKSRTLSQGTESRSGLQQQMEFESEINQQEEEEVFERDTEQVLSLQYGIEFLLH